MFDSMGSHWATCLRISWCAHKHHSPCCAYRKPGRSRCSKHVVSALRRTSFSTARPSARTKILESNHNASGVDSFNSRRSTAVLAGVVGDGGEGNRDEADGGKESLRGKKSSWRSYRLERHSLASSFSQEPSGTIVAPNTVRTKS